MTAVSIIGTTSSTSWRNRAACRGLDPQLFFPAPGESAAAARAVCAGCQVQADCAEMALSGHAEHYGIWGGLTARDRRRIRRARRRAVEPGPKGTEPMSPVCRIGCASETVPAGDCTADGYWHCSTCHVSFPNNASATFHETARPDHLLAWWCFDHNRLELIVASTPEAHR